jgi:hypothetical protein
VIVAYAAVETWVRRGAVSLLALAICACAHDKSKPPEVNIFPSDYKVQVADQVRRQLAPRNVRDAYISEPELKTFLPTPRFVACVQFNSMDSGAYKGGKLYAAYFYDGKITQVVNATVEQCDKASFLPFPELAMTGG